MTSGLNLLLSAPLSARLGMLMVLLVLLAAIFAPVIAPYGETQIAGDVWLSGSAQHLLGTDNLGRDLFTRLLFGARNTIAIAFLITALSFLMGTLLGFLAATVSGWTDQLLSRIIDILMAFPTLIFALMILSVVGTSIPALVVVIALLDSTRVFRLSRAVAMDIEVMEFVEAARLRGEGLWWLMRHEILPNAMPPLVAEFGLRFCFVFLFIAALSFLGLGIQPPTADWGSMVRENAGAITFGIYTPLWPATAIAFLTVGVNLVVDWFLHLASGLED
ncbi:ABC transporter permease [Desulfoprunum benzoelyticum]|uniref:Peptide/nickel transport system permease protein n=1 Tax=Desulfoprunum benzoelyticum TaxID=1506996 RepID=A0A840ULQ0_9BACT|nr:ABC transporter permease [Desulfoprunum benzoelyticum]MBB5346702.1 peptide/nickel transport system permease protein [Desulfoprunum benzoelyticum]MBM9529054.1 ABC transporter permease [Desulfoprunum benzoelyticum]